jgi:glycosyltransferase 2 family protein
MKRKTIYWIIRLIFSIAILVFLYTKIDFFQILSGLDRVSSIAIGAFLLNWLGGIAIPSLIAWRIAILEKNIGLSNFVIINHVNRFYSLALPLIVATGARYIQYRETGISKKHSMVILAINKLVTISVSLVTIIISSLFVLCLTGAEISREAFVESIYISTSLLLVLVVAVIFFRIIYINHAKEMNEQKMSVFCQFISAIYRLPHYLIAQVFALALFSAIVLAACQWLLVIDLELNVDFISVFWSRSILSLVLMLPFSIGGIGIRDFGLVATFAVFGVAFHDSAFIAILLLSFQVIYGILGFVFDQLSIKKKISDDIQ